MKQNEKIDAATAARELAFVADWPNLQEKQGIEVTYEEQNNGSQLLPFGR